MQDTHIRNIGQHGSALFTHPGYQRADHAGGFQQGLSRVGRFALRAEPTWDDGQLSAPHGAHSDQGAVSGGGRGASGGGNSDGLPLRAARGRGDLERPCFDLDVPSDGYAWWYVDGISDDGARAISIIGFIGSVFSPWYRWSGRKNPANHCCLNVVTYGRGGRWTMTDRGQSALGLSRDRLQIGPSAMVWADDHLRIEINEMSTPHAQRITGEVIIHPAALTGVEMALTPDGGHIWRPFAPKARIQVRLNRPRLDLDRAWLFRCQFRHPRARGRFPLLDMGAVPAPRWRRLFLRRPAPRWQRAGRRDRLCRRWHAARHRDATEGQTVAPRLDGAPRNAC